MVRLRGTDGKRGRVKARERVGGGGGKGERGERESVGIL